ncbi:probable protein phosphatase 2C 4 isoform X2 [Argentina anserina]|uniref:probable protein phosphatase 2C 4 isoform X2 n=1 Tax=Argentina anserina TaxID=57926 RepID=UPI0021763F3F|nr:probable protein phosphatase 2C 4 isoform X2 [Potentilla anserina]
MGNSFGKVSVCFTGAKGVHRHTHEVPVLLSDSYDEGLGHSFCYVRPDPTWLASSKVHSEEATTFKTISGASVSANTSTPLSTALVDLYSYNSVDRAAAFESSTSFASIPLQPIPRNFINSGPISGNFGAGVPGSGPLERGFLSGPIERAFMSGPLDRGLFSGPMEKGYSEQFQRSFSHGGGFAFKPRSGKPKLIRVLQRAISKTIYRGQNSILAPIKNRVVSVKDQDWIVGGGLHDSKVQNHNENLTVSSVNFSSEGSLEDDESLSSQNLQWAQGKAGEDRVHVVVSEEDGWVFVGIYDGFNGPDAPDYLLSNLYTAVHKELKGVIWDEKVESAAAGSRVDHPDNSVSDSDVGRNLEGDAGSRSVEEENYPSASGDVNFDSHSKKKEFRNPKTKYRSSGRKREDNQRRWRCEWDRERVELDRRLKEQLNRSSSDGSSAANHSDVLKALSQGLRKTEEAYLEIADQMLLENPELALMGSCVLVMLMKGEDVYVMNVGDSRVVLAQKAEPDYWLGKIRQDLERINEETLHDLEDGERQNSIPNLSAVQLTMDHSTSELEEVHRIRNEHPEDACAVMNDRVKGSLKVTRAFGAGFLKQVVNL